MEVRLTHVGGPTVLIETAGWRILTDPTLDPAGGAYRFGWGTGSRKTGDPALSAADLLPLDAILLTHDHHGDNLDAAGRALLPEAEVVVTTRSGARRLGGRARGLAPWEDTVLTGAGRPAIRVTATPCRHGPPLSRPLAGEVVGFALAAEGEGGGVLWITGDTVLFPGVREVPRRVEVGIAVMHLGGVRFPVTGPLRYSMTGREAVELCALADPRFAVPVHYEGWSHFHEGREGVERALAAAPAGVADRFRWLPPGEAVTFTT